MLDRHVVVLEALLHAHRVLQRVAQRVAHDPLTLSARDLRLLLDVLFNVLDELLHHGGERALARGLGHDLLRGLVLQGRIEQDVRLNVLLVEALGDACELLHHGKGLLGVLFAVDEAALAAGLHAQRAQAHHPAPPRRKARQGEGRRQA